MKNLIILACLILMFAPLAAYAQQTPSPATTVRDRLWLFGCPPGADAGYFENAGYRGGSPMTPVEGAHWLGVPNLLFITQDYNRPKAMWFESKWKAKTTMEQWAISFESMKRVNWAAVGSSGGGGLKTVPDIVTIAKGYPNLTGIYLDDFINDRTKRPDGTLVGKPAMSLGELKSMRGQLAKVRRPMEIWTTIYTREFDRQHKEFTDCEPPLTEFMKDFDVLVLWTWQSDELRGLEQSLAKLEAVKPKNCRIALGIYTPALQVLG